MLILSIDPGISGGLALLEFTPTDPKPQVIELLDMPLMPRLKDGTGNAVNFVVLSRELDRLQPTLVVLEQASAVAAPRETKGGKVQKQHGMGVAGAFNFGVGYGVLMGVAAKIPQVYVRPVSWKARLKVPSKKAGDDDFARRLALQLYPYLGEQLKRKKDLGRAEAVLIGTDFCRESVKNAGEDAGKPGVHIVPPNYTRELEL